MHAVGAVLENGKTDGLNLPDTFALQAQIEKVAAVVGSRQ
jgi:hypothetical protein